MLLHFRDGRVSGSTRDASRINRNTRPGSAIVSERESQSSKREPGIVEPVPRERLARIHLDIRLERFVAYILSGVVFERTNAGPVPLDGVELYCDSCGSPDGHTFVHTDANGFYELPWSMNGVHPLFVTKAGYEIFDPDHTLRDALGRFLATANGDTRLDIRMIRR
jgi:hypothetical protein